MTEQQPAKPKKRTGRRTILDEAKQKLIVDALTAGNYIETAAKIAGVAPASIYSWLDKGRTASDLIQAGHDIDENDRIYMEFAEAVEKARAQAEARNLLLIQQAAQSGTWQAAAWYLERSFPKRWGRKDKLEMTGKDEGPLEVTVSPADLEAKVQALLGKHAG
jgi:transposase-like protein